MQAILNKGGYDALMTAITHGIRLRKLREAAGLSTRELARQIGTNHSTIVFWEKGDSIPRSEVLASMSKSLGVSVEVLLGIKDPKSKPAGGKVGQVFEAVSNLPRRQQAKIVDIVEGLLLLHETKAS
jgi:transcriptional regulator with XRE-family HTH domain